MGLIPFWSCDISGYCGDITDYASFAELYVRWTQFGVFNPISRAHHEGNNAVEPWLFGAEAERIVKRERISIKSCVCRQSGATQSYCDVPESVGYAKGAISITLLVIK